MASPEVPMRITGQGDLAFKLLDICIESDGFIGSSAIIAHRPGISDELVYHKMLARELQLARSAIIFPLSQPLTLPLEPQPETLTLADEHWDTNIGPGKSFRLHNQSDAQGIKNLTKFRRQILPRKAGDSFPIIFVVDTLQKIPLTLEKELRTLIREAPMSKISVWLHCPLSSVPQDLFSVIGNVAVIWPSQSEFEILKNNLSVDRFIDNDGLEHHRGMLFISNIITPKGKGWQFSELEYEDLKSESGVIYGARA